MECLILGCNQEATMQGLCEDCYAEIHGEPVDLYEVVGGRVAVITTVMVVICIAGMLAVYSK